jgi:hypothetical protein
MEIIANLFFEKIKTKFIKPIFKHFNINFKNDWGLHVRELTFDKKWLKTADGKWIAV